jgi:HD superfamily phosphodiesterase
MQSQLATWWQGWNSGRARQRSRLDLADLRLPDSSIARASEALCRQVSPDFLVMHCLRTYLWGVILARIDGLKFDQELLYVAAMLHDLGHTTFHEANQQAGCFAIIGAECAIDFLEQQGETEQRRRAIGDAIALHMNSAPLPLSQGTEARLLQAGAALDVLGLRAGEVAPSTLTMVLERAPRHDFASQFAVLMHSQARKTSGTRAHLLERVLGLSGRIQRDGLAHRGERA